MTTPVETSQKTSTSVFFADAEERVKNAKLLNSKAQELLNKMTELANQQSPKQGNWFQRTILRQQPDASKITYVTQAVYDGIMSEYNLLHYNFHKSWNQQLLLPVRSGVIARSISVKLEEWNKLNQATFKLFNHIDQESRQILYDNTSLTIDSLYGQSKQLENAEKEYSDQYAKMARSIMTYEEERLELGKTKAHLESELQKIAVKYNTEQTSHETTRKSLKKLTTDLQSTRTSIAGLEAEIQDLNTKLQKAEHERGATENKLKDSNNQLDQAIKQHTAAQEQINFLSTEKKYLSEEYQAAKKLTETFEEELRKILEENDMPSSISIKDLKENIKKRKEAYDQAKERIENLEIDLQNVTKERDDAKKSIEDLSKDFNELTTKYNRAQQKIEELETNLNRVTTEHDAANQHIASLKEEVKILKENFTQNAFSTLSPKSWSDLMEIYRTYGNREKLSSMYATNPFAMQLGMTTFGLTAIGTCAIPYGMYRLARKAPKTIGGFTMAVAAIAGLTGTANWGRLTTHKRKNI